MSYILQTYRVIMCEYKVAGIGLYLAISVYLLCYPKFAELTCKVPSQKSLEPHYIIYEHYYIALINKISIRHGPQVPVFVS